MPGLRSFGAFSYSRGVITHSGSPISASYSSAVIDRGPCRQATTNMFLSSLQSVWTTVAVRRHPDVVGSVSDSPGFGNESTDKVLRNRTCA